MCCSKSKLSFNTSIFFFLNFLTTPRLTFFFQHSYKLVKYILVFKVSSKFYRLQNYPGSMVFILCYLKEDTLKVHFCIILRDCKSSIKAELGNEHLMTGPTGNSEFCFPETLNIEVEGKQNSLTPERPVNK